MFKVAKGFVWFSSLGFLAFQVRVFSHVCVSIWWILKHLTDINYHLRSAVLGPSQSVAGGPFCSDTEREARMTFAESLVLLQIAKCNLSVPQFLHL